MSDDQREFNQEEARAMYNLINLIVQYGGKEHYKPQAKRNAPRDYIFLNVHNLTYLIRKRAIELGLSKMTLAQSETAEVGE